MCVAIKNAAHSLLSKEVLKKCEVANPDGMGMLMAVNGEFVVNKTLTEFDDFYDFYSYMRKKYPEKEILLHFRIATCGGVSEEMCHPFISGEVGFIHNGMISGVGQELKKSDTCLFGEKILKGLPTNWIKNDFIVHMITNFVGTNNKLILMNKQGETVIVNELQGDFDQEGNWFSNTYWKYKSEYNYTGRVGDWVLENGVYVKKTNQSQLNWD